MNNHKHLVYKEFKLSMKESEFHLTQLFAQDKNKIFPPLSARKLLQKGSLCGIHHCWKLHFLFRPLLLDLIFCYVFVSTVFKFAIVWSLAE